MTMLSDFNIAQVVACDYHLRHLARIRVPGDLKECLPILISPEIILFSYFSTYFKIKIKDGLLICLRFIMAAKKLQSFVYTNCTYLRIVYRTRWRGRRVLFRDARARVRSPRLDKCLHCNLNQLVFYKLRYSINLTFD